MAVWDVPAAALPSRRRSSGADEPPPRIEARVRSKILPYRGARIKFATPNPKQSLASEHGKKSKRRYDAYMGATTVGEFLSCGGRPADLCYDVERGYCEVTDARWAAAVAEEAKDDEAEEGAGAARLRDERWAARYDEVCWAREGDVWWPGVVMDPRRSPGPRRRARASKGSATPSTTSGWTRPSSSACEDHLVWRGAFGVLWRRRRDFGSGSGPGKTGSATLRAARGAIRGDLGRVGSPFANKN